MPDDDLPRGAIIVVRDGRHPFNVLTMIACVVVGAMGLLGPPSSTSTIDRFIAEPWNTFYYTALLVSGMIVSVAIWLPDLRDRLIWSRVGLLLFTGVLLCYPLATLHAGAEPAEAVISALFGIAGLARIIDITFELRAWKRTVTRLKAAQKMAEESDQR